MCLLSAWLRHDRAAAIPDIGEVSRRPALITQADVARTIRAAKQAGAAEVEIRLGAATIVIRIASSTGAETDLEPQREIVL